VILEHALLSVTPGEEAAYESSMRKALPIIESAEGCFGAEVRAQVEDPSVYLLLVRWESVAAHMAFRDSDAFDAWRALTHHFYNVTPSVTHFLEPLEP
jgi:heme-degrading monooxygenase HmoA